MKRFILALAAAMAATGAHAYTYQFSYASNTSVPSQSTYQVAMGVITTSDTANSDGSYDILKITGTVNVPGTTTMSNITGLTGPVEGYGDNKFFPGGDPGNGGAPIDIPGIDFTSDAGYAYNLEFIDTYNAPVYPGSYILFYLSPEGVYDYSVGDASFTQVRTPGAPEPGVWLLTTLGVGMTGVALRKARRPLVAA
jgi:hypothetical protein